MTSAHHDPRCWPRHPELSNPAQVKRIDQVEAGGTLIAEPRETPWRSVNSRLTGPAGLQITLFQELDRPAG